MDRVELIARVVHEAIRAYQISLGEVSSPPWDLADNRYREATVSAVRFRIDNPDAKASAQHEHWMGERLSHGWAYGPVKDVERKTHPSLRPFVTLPLAERRKDALIAAVVAALTRTDV